MHKWQITLKNPNNPVVQVSDIQHLMLRLFGKGADPKQSKFKLTRGEPIGLGVMVLVPFLSAEILKKYLEEMPTLKMLMNKPEAVNYKIKKPFIFHGNTCPYIHGVMSVHLGTSCRKNTTTALRSLAIDDSYKAEDFDVTVKTHRQHSDSIESFLVNAKEINKTQKFTVNEDHEVTECPPGFCVLRHAQTRHESYTSDSTALDTDPMWLRCYALDCEMVEVENEEEEVGRVAVVDSSLRKVLDCFIKPQGMVKDYRTKFSGLTKEILADASYSLADVHAELSRRLPSDAILVGHSIDNDIAALKLAHGRLLDTSVLYTHPCPPLKHSLKALVHCVLKLELSRSDGHDPVEDAEAAMKLAAVKMLRGPDFARHEVDNPEPLAEILQPTAVHVWDSEKHEKTRIPLLSLQRAEIHKGTDDHEMLLEMKRTINRETEERTLHVCVLRALQKVSSLAAGFFLTREEKLMWGSEDLEAEFPYEPSPAGLRDVMKQIDRSIRTVWESLPPDSPMLVMSHTGNLSRNRRLGFAQRHPPEGVEVEKVQKAFEATKNQSGWGLLLFKH